MQDRSSNEKFHNFLVPTSVLVGGIAGLLISNTLWPTPSEFREHGWEPGLIILACIFAVAGVIAALGRWRGRF